MMAVTIERLKAALQAAEKRGAALYTGVCYYGDDCAAQVYVIVYLGGIKGHSSSYPHDDSGYPLPFFPLDSLCAMDDWEAGFPPLVAAEFCYTHYRVYIPRTWYGYFDFPRWSD